MCSRRENILKNSPNNALESLEFDRSLYKGEWRDPKNQTIGSNRKNGIHTQLQKIGRNIYQSNS
jgi:hypothetical protein